MKSLSRTRAVALAVGICLTSVPSSAATKPKVGQRCARAEALSPNGLLVCKSGTNRKLAWTSVRSGTPSKTITAGARGRGPGLVPSKFGIQPVQSIEMKSIPSLQEDSTSPDVPRTVLYSSGQSGSWSPDGSQVSFYRVNEDSSGVGVWVVGGDGTNPHLVSELKGRGSYVGESPSWSADGSQIAYIDARSTSGASLILVRPDGNGFSDVGNPFKETGAFLTSAVWSPTERQLALTGVSADCPSGTTVCGTFRSDVFLFTPDNGTLRKLATLPNLAAWSVTWSPNGDSLAIQAGDNSNPGSRTYIVSSSGRWFQTGELGTLFPTYSSRQRNNLPFYWGQSCSLWAKGGCLV
jgi:WD40-like Beta Propeller Repeat